jgi:hypothetical protein
LAQWTLAVRAFPLLPPVRPQKLLKKYGPDDSLALRHNPNATRQRQQQDDGMAPTDDYGN